MPATTAAQCVVEAKSLCGDARLGRLLCVIAVA